MKLNITRFFTGFAQGGCMASSADAGDGKECMILDSEEKREAFRKHLAVCGAWSNEGLAKVSDEELNVLCIDEVSSDIREGALDCASPDWEQYCINSEIGRMSGNIFQVDGEVYYSID